AGTVETPWDPFRAWCRDRGAHRPLVRGSRPEPHPSSRTDSCVVVESSRYIVGRGSTANPTPPRDREANLTTRSYDDSVFRRTDGCPSARSQVTVPKPPYRAPRMRSPRRSGSAQGGHEHCAWTAPSRAQVDDKCSSS